MRLKYWPLLVVPPVMFGLGFMLNAVSMAFNNGQMPTLWPGGCGSFEQDPLHACMGHATHLKLISDWIIIRSGVSVSIASPGDLLEWACELIQWPCIYIWATLMVRDHSTR